MDPTPSPIQAEKGSKPCSRCNRARNVLIRCQIDATQKWHFICTGKCWNEVSGGKVDGPGFPNYRYGGMWKNKHAGASAKIKGKAKVVNGHGGGEREEETKGDGRRKERRGEMGENESGDQTVGSSSCGEDREEGT